MTRPPKYRNSAVCSYLCPAASMDRGGGGGAGCFSFTRINRVSVFLSDTVSPNSRSNSTILGRKIAENAKKCPTIFCGPQNFEVKNATHMQHEQGTCMYLCPKRQMYFFQWQRERQAEQRRRMLVPDTSPAAHKVRQRKLSASSPSPTHKLSSGRPYVPLLAVLASESSLVFSVHTQKIICCARRSFTENKHGLQSKHDTTASGANTAKKGTCAGSQESYE